MICNLLCLRLESVQVNQHAIGGSVNSYFLFNFTVKVEYLFLKDWWSWLAVPGNRTLFIFSMLVMSEEAGAKQVF